MKKYIILILTLSFFFFQCSEEKIRKNDLSTENLKGKVKYLKETKNKAIEKFGEIEKGELISKSTYGFDINGYKTEHNELFANDEIFRKIIYRYNEKHYLIKDSSYFPNINAFDRINTYVYDDNDNLMEKNVFFKKSDSLEYRWIYKYNKKGYLEEINVYDYEGGLALKLTYKYDWWGNRKEEKEFSYDGDLLDSYTYKYDWKGKLTKKILIKADNNCTFSYDKNGDLNEINPGYHNNTKGKLSMKYEYDNFGNWIKMVTFWEDIPVKISERKIEYYF